MGKKKRRRKKGAAGMGGLGPGVRLSIAPPGTQIVSRPFQLKKVADVGTANPLVARLDTQMFDLVDALGLPKADRDTILEHTHVGSQWFLRAEQNKNEYALLSGRFMARAVTGTGIRVQGAALAILEPLNLGDYYQLFLIDLTIGLRLFFKAAGLVLTGRPIGWHDLKATVEQSFAHGHPLRVLIDKHGGWSKTLYDDRGDVEHDPYMFTGFQVGTNPQGDHFLLRPRGADGRPLEEIMETYFQDGFAFAEELVAFAIESQLPPGRQVIEIPEPQRNSRAPVRFQVR